MKEHYFNMEEKSRSTEDLVSEYEKMLKKGFDACLQFTMLLNEIEEERLAQAVGRKLKEQPLTLEEWRKK